MSIKSGTPCFLSQKGHNNFIYPIYEESGLTFFIKDVEDYETRPWICGVRNLKAIVVDVSCLDKIVSDSKAKTVVWVDTEKTLLK